MIERVFLGWDEPILRTAARYLADRSTSAGTLDLRETDLVVAGGRAGRRLKELLLGEADGRGVSLQPPRVVTIGGLPELFYRSVLPVAPPLVVRRAWAEALRAGDPAVLAVVFPDLPDDSDHLGWDALAEQVASLWREVTAGAHDFAAVARLCRSSEFIFDDSERWDALAQVEGRYRKILDELGFADLDRSRLDHLFAGACRAERDIYLVGLAELPPLARRFVAACTSSVVSLVAAPDELADYFDEVGCVLPSRWSSRVIPLEREQISVVDRPSDQAAELVRLAGELGGEVAEMVVGVADETLVPAVEEWFGAAGVPIHSAKGSPIEGFPVYRILLVVAEFLERRSWEDFAAIIRHPDLARAIFGGTGAAASSLIDLDAIFNRQLPSRLPRGQVGGRAQSRVARLDELLAELDRSRSLREWGEPLLTFLQTVFGPRRLNPNIPADRRLADVLRMIREVAAGFASLPDRLSPVVGGAAALRLMAAMLSGRHVPRDSEVTALEVVGWLEFASDDAPTALLAGLNEGLLPTARAADDFLPDGLRGRLGLRDDQTVYARDAYLLSALIHSRRLRVVAGRMTAEGDPLRPSRLALTARGRELALILKHHLGGAPPPQVPAPLVRRAGHRSSFSLPPQPTLGFDPPQELSVTDFRLILQDPYRFVLERLLKLERVDDEARELDARAFGSLIHDVLQAFGSAPELHSTNAEAIFERLDSLLGKLAVERFPNPTYPAVQVQLEQIRLRLRSFAEWQALRVAQGWRTLLVENQLVNSPQLELTPSAATATLDVDGQPIRIRGRIDRVDYHEASNQLLIVDYKTGERGEEPKDTHRSRNVWKDLQLPLYRHLLRALDAEMGGYLIPDGATEKFGYILLPRDRQQVRCATADWEEADLLEADETAREAVRKLREAIVEFDPAEVSVDKDDPLGVLLGLRLLRQAAQEDEALLQQGEE